MSESDKNIREYGIFYNFTANGWSSYDIIGYRVGDTYIAAIKIVSTYNGKIRNLVIDSTNPESWMLYTISP